MILHRIIMKMRCHDGGHQLDLTYYDWTHLILKNKHRENQTSE